jgi:hypothetical protein
MDRRVKYITPHDSLAVTCSFRKRWPIGHSRCSNLRTTVLNLGGRTMKTLFTECSQSKPFAAIVAALTASDESRTHAVECQKIAEHHGDPIKEQYEARAREWLASFPRIA